MQFELWILGVSCYSSGVRKCPVLNLPLQERKEPTCPAVFWKVFHSRLACFDTFTPNNWCKHRSEGVILNRKKACTLFQDDTIHILEVRCHIWRYTSSVNNLDTYLDSSSLFWGCWFCCFGGFSPRKRIPLGINSALSFNYAVFSGNICAQWNETSKIVIYVD